MATRKLLDGWHTICGFTVWVEDGRIIRGIWGEGNRQRTVYPYRLSKSGGWDNCSGLTVDAFRAGYKRDTVTMM